MELNRRQLLQGVAAGAASFCISPRDTFRALHRELLKDKYPAPTYIDIFSPIKVSPNLGNNELRNAIQTRLNDSFLNHGPKVRAFHEAIERKFFNMPPATDRKQVDIAATISESMRFDEGVFSVAFDPSVVTVSEMNTVVFAFQAGTMTASIKDGNLDVNGGYTASPQMKENWTKLLKFGEKCANKSSILIAAAGNNNDDVAYVTKDDKAQLPFLMAAEFDGNNTMPRSGVRLPEEGCGLSAYYVDNAAFLRQMGGEVLFDKGVITDATGSTFSTATLAAMVDMLRAHGPTDLSEIKAHLDAIAETKSFAQDGSMRGAKPKNYKVITPESATKLQNYLLRHGPILRSRAV